VGIAFFDFDRTLIAANSGTLWVRRELSLGHITRWQALRALSWIGAYQLGMATMEDALRKAISMLAGHPERALRERTSAFYAQEVKGLYRPGARAALEAHRAKGDELVLCTASSLYLSEWVGEELGFDALLCNRFEVDAHGLHTGRSVGEICFGAGKLELARAHAAARNVPLSACTFYTDSYSDLPMLEAVGSPVAVNPDGRLRRRAVQLGWPVVDWGEAEPLVDAGPSLAG
jgi:HAD superfamily hydrolase (TIGR01490 family)